MIMASPSVRGALKDSIDGQAIGSMIITFTADNPITIKSTATDSSEIPGDCTQSTKQGGYIQYHAQLCRELAIQRCQLTNKDADRPVVRT